MLIHAKPYLSVILIESIDVWSCTLLGKIWLWSTWPQPEWFWGKSNAFHSYPFPVHPCKRNIFLHPLSHCFSAFCRPHWQYWPCACFGHEHVSGKGRGCIQAEAPCYNQEHVAQRGWCWEWQDLWSSFIAGLEQSLNWLTAFIWNVQETNVLSLLFYPLRNIGSVC